MGRAAAIFGKSLRGLAESAATGRFDNQDIALFNG
jgi:hypothetical protein